MKKYPESNIRVSSIDYTGSPGSDAVYADMFFRFEVEDDLYEFVLNVYYEIDEDGVIRSSDSEEDIIDDAISAVAHRMRYRDRTSGRGYRRN